MLSDISYDPHVSTLNHVNKLLDICDNALSSEEVKELDDWQVELHPDLAGKIVISCDASIKENPGGPASSGVVIRFVSAGMRPYKMARILPTAVTNNQAEYDAVYEGLSYFRTFGPGPTCKAIEIRTDSKLVVNQLNGVWEVKDENLKHRHESVSETLTNLRERLEIPIEIVWYPRNSTDDLKQANYLAQDILGVKNH
jgi:ribonuclease HI